MSGKFGHIEMSGKDIGVPAQQFDRIALSGRSELLLLSVITDIHNLKRMRSILVGGAKAVISASGVKVKQPSQQEWYANTPGRVNTISDGYTLHTHKLGFGLVHALFMTRAHGFMPVVTQESLWRELKHTRFTTPVIREWVPYIEQELRSKELLEEAHVYNCQCGVLSATTKDLDEIVSEGLRQRELLITETVSYGKPSAIVADAGVAA